MAALVSRSGGAAQSGVCRPLGRPCFPEHGVGCCAGDCQDGRCRCPGNARPCRGRCLPKRKCCRSNDCPANQTCRQGRCQCPAGKRRCGKRCIAANACCRNKECGAGGECVKGQCRCAAGRKPCNGACVANAVCCGGCTADQNCVNGTCEAKRCGAGAPCRVFVTSTPYFGDLREGGIGSGIAGADAKCQARAQAAGLSGTYRAWISDSTAGSAPVDRFTSVANTGPYVLVNGTEIAASWADLTDGSLAAPINVTELGGSAQAAVWTYTLDDGTAGGNQNVHCLDWTSASGANGGDVGFTDFDDDRWTKDTTSGCSNGDHRLYCFEQG